MKINGSYLRLAVIAPLLLGLTGCPKVSVTVSSGYPGSYGQPGTFATYGVAIYEDPSADFGVESFPTPADTANTFSDAMRHDQWNETISARANRGSTEWDVNNSGFARSFGGADAVWFSGHGTDGSVQFAGAEMSLYQPENQCWGVGHNYNDGECHLYQQVNGRTKWLFTYSSDTVSAPQTQWPSSPQNTANWLPVFGGSLHGLYGFWQPPGSCSERGAFSPIRKCDIKKELGPDFAKKLVQLMIELQPNNKTVHESWVMAAGTLGNFGNWSIWEDANAKYDYITGGPTSTPSGNIWYYNAANKNGFPVGHVNVGSERFSLNALSLNPEYVDDNALINAAQPYYGPPDTYTNDGQNTYVRKDNTFSQHYLPTGATVYYGNLQYNAVAFDETTALNTALTAINNGQGLPSDALLAETDYVYQTSPVDGSQIQTGYQFVWKHSSGPFGNDAIRVIVDDYQYERNTTCSEWDWTDADPPMRPMRYCAAWNTVTVDNPNVAFLYRMWRTVRTSRQVQSIRGPSTGTYDSIDAYTASLSLPPEASPVGYQPGYWTGAASDPNGNAGTPAWVFQLSGGGEAYVDATSGVYLGSVFG